MDDIPTVSILVLGDPGCGKSTFLARINKGRDGHSASDLTLLRDLDQPYIYDVNLYSRLYRFKFSDTASPNNFTLLKPDFIIICYDISERESLINARDLWRKDAIRYYQSDREDIPVMLVGLKRDLRVENEDTLYPQEGYRVAQEMRCDIYAECSALTGELVKETIEDIMKGAAKTTTENGGLTPGGCVIL
ncbi:MAG: hypothetical protein M1834_007122 [Cirrosporium novae-zelandiae]|nr:MAG: hypothetical protein M1834_007122 [Cirrosporium novae-zelandiae]